MISVFLLCVTLGCVYPAVSGFEHNISVSRDATGSIQSSIELATSKSFTSTEASINNDTQHQTSNFNVSASVETETQTSPFSSSSHTAVTTELSTIKEWMSATAVTNSDIPEIKRTRTVTEVTTTATSTTTKTATSTTTETSTSTTTETSTSTTTETTDECKPDNCTPPGNCIYTKNSGCIRLREDATERSFSYTIMLENESSLIYVEMEPEHGNLIPGSSITFQFEECERMQDTWELKEGEKITRKIYISRTSNLTLHIFTDKSWINSTLRYKELASEAKEDRAKDTVDEGNLYPPMLAGIRYRPMINVTYLLTASKSRWNESSVTMTLSFVDLDDGDYLLIGAGNKPFAGPAPFYFTGRQRNSRNYYIASDNVYVVFVSGASQKVDKKGFHIKWKRSGTAITKPDEDHDDEAVPDSIIQSVGICFYNKSLIAEFNTTEDYEGPIQNFREKLAAVANNYAKKNSIRLDSLLTDSSVEIFRVSSVIAPTEDMPDGGLYVMVSIVNHFDRETAVFRRRQLEEIIDELDKKNKESGYLMLGFKLSVSGEEIESQDCPCITTYHRISVQCRQKDGLLTVTSIWGTENGRMGIDLENRAVEYQRNKAGHCPDVNSYVEWYITAVLLALISTIALIIVWIYTSISKWKGYRNRRKSSDRSRNKYCKEPEVPARENDYVRCNLGFIKPKMKLTSADGDTITLESENLDQPMSDQEDGPDTVVYHDDWIMKSRPSSIEVPMYTTADIETRQILQTFAASVPSTKKNVYDRMWTDMPMNRLLPQGTTQVMDHEYDSLVFPSISASSTTCLVNDEVETRL